MPGAMTNGKCGPEVGGDELYRTDAIAACDTCGLCRIGTAVPGRQLDTRSGATDPATEAVMSRHWLANEVPSRTARHPAVPIRQSQRLIGVSRRVARAARGGRAAWVRMLVPQGVRAVRPTPRRRPTRPPRWSGCARSTPPDR